MTEPEPSWQRAAPVIVPRPRPPAVIEPPGSMPERDSWGAETDGSEPAAETLPVGDAGGASATATRRTDHRARAAAVACVLVVASLVLGFGAVVLDRSIGIASGTAGADAGLLGPDAGRFDPGRAAPGPGPIGAQAPAAGSPGGGSPGSVLPDPAPRVPGLDEARAQFALLEQAARDAIGPEAIWRTDAALTVAETPCDGGTALVLSGVFGMGVVDDTTTLEHDDEVIAANIAASERIARAWLELGLSGVDIMKGEQYLGAGEFGAVESARLGYDYGVATPRVQGVCIPDV